MGYLEVAREALAEHQRREGSDPASWGELKDQRWGPALGDDEPGIVVEASWLPLPPLKRGAEGDGPSDEPPRIEGFEFIPEDRWPPWAIDRSLTITVGAARASIEHDRATREATEAFRRGGSKGKG